MGSISDEALLLTAKNKSIMNEKYELFEILKEVKRGNKMAAEAYDQILLLFDVVGQSEQCCDKCGSEYYHTYKCVNTKCENCIIHT